MAAQGFTVVTGTLATSPGTQINPGGTANTKRSSWRPFSCEPGK